MALNWAMLNPNRTPVPLPNEMTITTVDSGVDVVVTIPPRSYSSNAPSSSSSSSYPPPISTTTAGSFQKLKATGRVWLTDQRFIYVAEQGSSFESLSVPLPAILSSGFHQPAFGTNYINFELKPSRDGNLTDGTSVEIRFKDRPMFEFVSLIEKTRERAIYMKRQATEEAEGDGLRKCSSRCHHPPQLTLSSATYTLPAESSSVTMIGGVPVENPPGYDY